MIILTQRESEIVEMIREGKLDLKGMNEKQGTPMSNLTARLTFLVESSYVERIGRGKYRALIQQSDYEVRAITGRNKKKKFDTGMEIPDDQELAKVSVPENIADFLKKHYKANRKHRTKLAKHLGITKTDLNLYLIEMGLGKL